jgi:hypothetical protein
VREPRPRSWLGWLSIGVLSACLMGWFGAAGGLGAGHGTVALADTTTSTVSVPSGTSMTTLGITLPVCGGPTLTGSVKVDRNFTGVYTLALLGLSPTITNLDGHFVDTGVRASATFSNAQLAPFTFSVAGGWPAYAVAVVPTDGNLDHATLAVSQAVPLCNTVPRTVTATTTAMDTTTATMTTTETDYRTITNDVVHTVTIFDSGTFTFSPPCEPFPSCFLPPPPPPP